MTKLTQLGIQSLNPAASTGKQWWSKPTTDQFASVNPATKQILAQVSRCTLADYEHVIQQSQHAFKTWQQVPAPRRGELVRQIADQLRAKKDWLGTLVSLEAGKIKQEGDGEVQEMIDMADFAVGLARMLGGKTMPSERLQHRMYEQWHPLDSVGVITAFNFPVAVWSWNAFIAAVCGNTVVWKPSSKVPLSAIAVQHICNEVMAANGYEAIFCLWVSDDNQLATHFVQDQRLALISFTGSSPVGRQVAVHVSQRLGRSLLELSGNNAVIIDESADLSLAIPAVVFGAVGTAGQRCTTTRRLIIQQNRYQEVVEKLVQAYSTIRIGDPLDPEVLMGPLIDQAAVDQYVATIQSVRDLGGKIIYGGKPLSGGPGYFVQPTLVEAKPNWPVLRHETFAPILYVLAYESLEQAIALHNDVPQGLSSGLFTGNLYHAEQFLSTMGSDCGIANINVGTSGAEIGGAFGGEKETGGGREAGSDAWKAYMRRQTVTINWGKQLPLAQGIRFPI